MTFGVLDPPLHQILDVLGQRSLACIVGHRGLEALQGQVHVLGGAVTILDVHGVETRVSLRDKALVAVAILDAIEAYRG